jgi:hypothetical protein
MRCTRAVLCASLAITGLLFRNFANAREDLEAVSARPDMVSGGDVLVRLKPPAQTHWSARLDGRDVTASFHPAEESTDELGLLSGLGVGRHLLTLEVSGQIRSSLEVMNHPLAGPIFSGPHQEPFLCQTEASGLGPAEDADCTARTLVQYYYKSTRPLAPASTTSEPSAGALAPGFMPYDPASPPADVARTVTSEGHTVDYIVRREVGVINRAVYEIQFLHKPGEALPTPWTQRRSAGWNGRLVYEFKGGCAAGYRQGTLTDAIGPLQEPLLSRGYALANSTLSAFANNCNDRVSAETLSMVREHFIEQYGIPVHTIGWGGSGGAMQVHLTAQNYPGLLDGIIAIASFPDLLSWLQTTTDCQLLDNAFRSARQSWTEEQKTAVSGYATWHMCDLVVKYELLYLDPRKCDRSVPTERIYDPAVNPKGARCDLYSNEINVFGRDPATGFALRPLDNVGVQYGLVAFNEGRIDAEQFLELNAIIGGFDADGTIVAARTEASVTAVRNAYERGIVLTGGGGLEQVPIIDFRNYTDDLGSADGHVRFQSYVTRARQKAASGQTENHVMLVDTREAWYHSRGTFWGPIGNLVPQMDRWLDAIAADRAPGPLAAHIARARPNDLRDGCTAVSGEKIFERASYKSAGRCEEMYPAYGDPRLAAGGPLTNDVLKCTLKPVSPADYVYPLSAAQLRRLREIFPDGVCDFTRPGIRESVTRETWQVF